MTSTDTNIHDGKIKSQLAKLLATENITVRHQPSAKTAYFDVKNRLLVLPEWKGISTDLYDMLVVHEVGHALDTPFEAWRDAIKNIAANVYPSGATDRQLSAIKTFLNVVEDARIDKRQKRRYPGSRSNYNVGYAELHERDFFGIKGKEVSKLLFIDRVNIWFKHGSHLNIPFTSAERSYLDRIGATETFQQVVELTEEIFKLAVDEAEKSASSSNDLEGEEGDEFETGASFDEDEGDGEFYDADEEGDGESGEGKAGEDEGEGEDNGEGKGKNGPDNEYESGQTKPAPASGYSPNSLTGKVPESITAIAEEKNREEIAANENVEYVYTTLPTINIDRIADDWTKVLPELEKSIYVNVYGKPGNTDYRNGYANLHQSLAEWRRQESQVISYMVKEFEMKKAATHYSRESISKTGVIETNKLHSYKFSEDIFRRVSTTPKGKNHGFYIVLDWSASMVDNLSATMKQLFSLALFCRRINVPFEVYSFRNASFEDRVYGEVFTSNKTGQLRLRGFKLRNILSSRMNTSNFNKALELLWIVAHNAHVARSEPMQSTPLNQAIVASEILIERFRKQNKLEVVNTIFLTDGGSDSIDGIQDDSYKFGISKKYFLQCDKTKKTYSLPSIHGYELTDALLRILRDRTNCNLVGFFLSRNLDPTILQHAFNADEAKTSWKQNGFAPIKSRGYHEYYIINTKTDRTVSELKVDSNMTQKRIASEFIKFTGKRTVNRTLLSRFVDKIARTA